MDLIKHIVKEQGLDVITIKCNVCGNNKNVASFEFLKKYFLNQIIETFNVYKYDYYESADGNYYLVQIKSDSELKVKHQLIALEDGVFGRMIDLDLYTSTTKSVSRRDLGVAPRSCIVCSDETTLCMRSGKHTVVEVVEKSHDIVKSDLVNYVVKLVKQAMYDEVIAEPKFGLVTKNTSGKHQDMDYNTFASSIEAITEEIGEYAYVGFNLNDNSFKVLREIGIRAEQKMYKATGNINTHKGTIFILGFLVPSIVDALYNNKPFKQIEATIKYLAKDIMLDFDNIKTMTAGEKAFLNYNITGVRGEVFNGLQKVFDIIDGLEKYDCKNSLVVDVLVKYMACIDDTVIVNSKGFECLEYVKSTAQEIIDCGGYCSVDGARLVDYYTAEFIRQEISPGGSADMTIATLILIEIGQIFY